MSEESVPGKPLRELTCDDESAIKNYAPYRYGSTRLQRAFAAHVKCLTRATMSSWQCAASVWPNAMPVRSAQQQAIGWAMMINNSRGSPAVVGPYRLRNADYVRVRGGLEGV
eukprot:1647374-Pyramimonas_sp.AAC.1